MAAKLKNIIKKFKKTAQNTQLQDTLDKVLWELTQIRKINFGQLHYNAMEYIEEIDSFYANQRLGYNETLELILKDRLSFARFGDGELSLILEPTYPLRFQKNSNKLSIALNDVLNSNNAKLLIGLPELFRGDFHWQTQAWPRIFPALQPLIGNSLTYGQAQVSRPIYFAMFGAEALEKWRAIFEKRNIIFIYGCGSRFVKSPALFDGINSGIDIHSVPKDAFEDIPRILEAVKEKSNSDSLALIALGPAGTVLAHQLSQLGIQALDIGHLSSSYEYWANASLPPEQLPIENL